MGLQPRAFLKGVEYALHHCLLVPIELAVPDAKHAEAATLKVRIANWIIWLVSVLTPVELDDQPPPVANEVGNVAAYGNLTPETKAEEPTAAQEGPQLPFMWR